jgi:Flp pilus assembly protein CpaB
MATPKPQPVVTAAAPAVEKPTTKVLVAKNNLTIGHRIERDDVSWQSWPVESHRRQVYS